MYSIVIIINNIILQISKLLRRQLLNAVTTHRKRVCGLCEVTEVVSNTTMVISLQYLRTKSAHLVYLKHKVICQWGNSKSGKKLLSRWAALGIDCVQSLSLVRLFETPWPVVCSLLCPWGFSRLGFWSGFAVSSSEFFPAEQNPGLPTLQIDYLISEPSSCLLLASPQLYTFTNHLVL